MKKTIILAVLLLGSITAFSQATPPQKKLPATVTVSFTSSEAIRIDSLLQSTAQQLDSKSQSRHVFEVFAPFYKQIQNQLISSDSTAKPQPVKSKKQ